MTTLSRRMVRALADAEACKNHRGLERLHGGYWHPTRNPGMEPHHHRTIGALIERGYLQTWGDEHAKVAHITEVGEIALAQWREDQATRAQPVASPAARP